MTPDIMLSLPLDVLAEVEAAVESVQREYAMQEVEDRYTVRGVNAAGRAERLRAALDTIRMARDLAGVPNG